MAPTFPLPPLPEVARVATAVRGEVPLLPGIGDGAFDLMQGGGQGGHTNKKRGEDTHDIDKFEESGMDATQQQKATPRTRV